jgi:hypothetical protein
LLAVLVTVRSQAKTLTFTIFGSSQDFIPFVDMLILLWSCYAFFMVLGLSEDAIGKTLAESCKFFSMLFLQLSFIGSTFLAMFYFALAQFARFVWVMLLIVFSLLMLFSYADEQYFPTIVVIGFVSIAIFSVANEMQTKEKTESLKDRN